MMLPAAAPAGPKIPRAQLVNDLAAANAQVAAEQVNVRNAQALLNIENIRAVAAENTVNGLQLNLQALQQQVLTEQGNVAAGQLQLGIVQANLVQAQHDLAAANAAVGVEQANLAAANVALLAAQGQVGVEQANVAAARNQVVREQQNVVNANALVVLAGLNLQAAQNALAAANAQVGVEQGNVAAIQLLLNTANNDLAAANAQVGVEQAKVLAIQALLDTANNNLATVRAQLANTQTCRAEYSKFAAVVRPVVALAAGAASVYTLYHNPVMISDGVNLLCRNVGTEMTFDGLNAILKGCGEVLATLLAGPAAYGASYLITPALMYGVLTIVNFFIRTIPSKILSKFVDVLAYVFQKARNNPKVALALVLGLTVLCMGAYGIPSVNSIVASKFAEIAKEVPGMVEYVKKLPGLISNEFSSWTNAGGIGEVAAKIVEFIRDAITFITSNASYYGPIVADKWSARVSEGVNLLCRTVGTDMTFDRLNEMLSGYAVGVTTTVAGITGIAALKFRNAIKNVIRSIILFPFKVAYEVLTFLKNVLVHVLRKANEHRAITGIVAFVVTAALLGVQFREQIMHAAKSQTA